MNSKQQLVTGFLAMIIVGSVALMPVNAEVKGPQVSRAPQSGNMVAALNTAELPQEHVKDLTYN